ncbi:hypothetical protein B0H17DRAFT_1248821 [Mycena rosella]|uniref:Uncharacterized protein n=1 Tax=Mycena rosella TaxID=1033263 RepID=A0AAD7CXE2_MYCRO|nr:hypothetical protein B0H17DRAFT_1248821 [Mycena rosella]
MRICAAAHKSCVRPFSTSSHFMHTSTADSAKSPRACFMLQLPAPETTMLLLLDCGLDCVARREEACAGRTVSKNVSARLRAVDVAVQRLEVRGEVGREVGSDDTRGEGCEVDAHAQGGAEERRVQEGSDFGVVTRAREAERGEVHLQMYLRQCWHCQDRMGGRSSCNIEHQVIVSPEQKYSMAPTDSLNIGGIMLVGQDRDGRRQFPGIEIHAAVAGDELHTGASRLDSVAREYVLIHLCKHLLETRGFAESACRRLSVKFDLRGTCCVAVNSRVVREELCVGRDVPGAAAKLTQAAGGASEARTGSDSAAQQVFTKQI